MLNKTVTQNDIENEISNLDSTKNGTVNGIPTKRLKDASDICSEYLVKIWNNEIIENGTFPDKLKLADVTPIFKKDDATQAKNYRPIKPGSHQTITTIATIATIILFSTIVAIVLIVTVFQCEQKYNTTIGIRFMCNFNT